MPLPRSPWEQWFSAGTSISSGLLLAAQLLEQRPYTDRGVVLISDLADDPSDFQKLADTIALYSRRSIPLNVVALDPAPEDREFFLELLDNPGAISNVQLPTAQTGRGRLAIASGFPWTTAFARRVRRRGAGGQRVLDRAAPVAEEPGMTRLVAGVGCLALSCVALLFARDVWHADDALRDADLRGSVQPLSARSWESGETIPFGAARAALGIDDDLEYRALVARAIAMTKQEAVTPAQFRERLPVQTALHRVKNGDDDARRRSDAANLLGLLILGDPEDARHLAPRDARAAGCPRVPLRGAGRPDERRSEGESRADAPEPEVGEPAGPGQRRRRQRGRAAARPASVHPVTAFDDARGLLLLRDALRAAVRARVARSRRRVPRSARAARGACGPHSGSIRYGGVHPAWTAATIVAVGRAPRRRARPAGAPHEDDAARPRGRGGVLRVRHLALDARRRVSPSDADEDGARTAVRAPDAQAAVASCPPAWPR